MIKLLVGLLIIACIAPLFLKGPDGGPIMTLDDWKFEIPDSVTALFDKGSEMTLGDDAALGAESTTVYKWQDDDGQWHFSTTLPAQQVVEEMELSGDINIMEAYVPPPEEVIAQTSAAPSMPTGPLSVSPDQLKDMMETVNNLQDTVDQRKANIDAVVAPGK